MVMLSQKETSQPSVEGVLNLIYTMPDLKDDVLGYLTPVLIKAYGLVKRDNEASDNARMFEHEDRRQLENILFHDLPELIDLYTQMPIGYRNEKNLKNGQTHRDVLINNLKLLVKSIQGLESKSFANVDKDMSVKGRIYQEKYKTALAYEAQLESESQSGVVVNNGNNENDTRHEFVNRFSWEKYQKKHQPELSLKNVESIYGKTDNEHVIRVRDGQVHYQAKDRLKAIIRTVRQYGGKIAMTPKNVATYLWENYHGLTKTVLIIGGIFLALYGFVHYMNNKYRHFSAVSDLTEEVTPLYNNPTPLMHNLTVKMLGSFEAEHQSAGARLFFDDKKTKVTINETMTKNECMHFIDQAQNYYTTHGLPYRINDNLYNTTQNLGDQLQNMICISPLNTLTVTFLLKEHK